MALRFVLLLVSAIMIIGSAVALVVGYPVWPLLIWSSVVFLAICFERWHYSTSATSMQHGEYKTGERFIDPASGAMMDVIYDEKTGERRYMTIPTGIEKTNSDGDRR